MAAFAASVSAGHAGPCEITQVRGEIDARLKAQAVGAPAAGESTAAKLHRQPTQNSVAESEAKLGVTSPEKVKTIRDAMERANKADNAGDRNACEQALADARRALAQ
jgi:hypothetical protein